MKSTIHLYPLDPNNTTEFNFSESIYNSEAFYNFSVFQNFLPPMISDGISSEPTIVSAEIETLSTMSLANTDITVTGTIAIDTDVLSVQRDKYFDLYSIISNGSTGFEFTDTNTLARVKIATDGVTFYSELFYITTEELSPWFFRNESGDGSRTWDTFGIWTDSDDDIWI